MLAEPQLYGILRPGSCSECSSGGSGGGGRQGGGLHKFSHCPSWLLNIHDIWDLCILKWFYCNSLW